MSRKIMVRDLTIVFGCDRSIEIVEGAVTSDVSEICFDGVHILPKTHEFIFEFFQRLGKVKITGLNDDTLHKLDLLKKKSGIKSFNNMNELKSALTKNFPPGSYAVMSGDNSYDHLIRIVSYNNKYVLIKKFNRAALKKMRKSLNEPGLSINETIEWTDLLHKKHYFSKLSKEEMAKLKPYF